MKKSLFGLIALFILLTTYTPRFNFILNSNLHIQKIKIENNSIVEADKIKKKLSFLYEENLFFLNIKDIKKNLKSETFIESFSIKKIYPNTLKLIIVEKKPIAILQNKKKKFYISNKGDFINFKDVEGYNDLPTVFGNGKSFYSLYQDLQNIRFPLETIKSFYFFESGRWDLVMHDDKVIKLPIKNYLSSLKNFMLSKVNSNFNNYKIFDYRIKDQLILN
ncbi:MAG: FtsQ-type POTRA domain-containing protein [Candidatus Pelagibacter sp. TMED253]|nr:MAG: FtsQ-type POTRA domain-containing protein [Candidatus Pelagibacter sp. TMED253]|tara:strand:- start:6832 stop:7491 length:660 start_codon:yes stop_codon:yes gene_type:complete